MYKFRTIADYEPDEGISLTQEGDLTERSGYRSLEDQINDLMSAGELLEDYRKNQFPEVETPAHVFMDKMEAAELSKEIGAKKSKAEAESRKAAEEAQQKEREAQFEAEVEKRMAAKASEVKPEPNGPVQQA